MNKEVSIAACLANLADAVMRAVDMGADNLVILDAVRKGFVAGKRDVIHIHGKFK